MSGRFAVHCLDCKKRLSVSKHVRERCSTCEPLYRVRMKPLALAARYREQAARMRECAAELERTANALDPSGSQ